MGKRLLIIFLGLNILISSCCLTIKEKNLGNSLYLSEYDKFDRRIFYAKERCTGGGFEIVPMSVTEYAFDENWIIAKTGFENSSDQKYWVIKKIDKANPTIEEIKRNSFGPLNLEEYTRKLRENRIELVLKRIK